MCVFILFDWNHYILGVFKTIGLAEDARTSGGDYIICYPIEE